ncbi:hypothetical protein REMIM1_CH04093 [Rhizobium etli bv. mimosae str. Mim1]|nr:hypothetical protein REMIM1_CH04093 [Rhizobium etli bv. mimosae str. Mim1]
MRRVSALGATPINAQPDHDLANFPPIDKPLPGRKVATCSALCLAQQARRLTNLDLNYRDSVQLFAMVLRRGY